MPTMPAESAPSPAAEVIDLVVNRRTTVADGVVELELRSSTGGPLPTWHPGAHIDLHLGNGLVRQYSLCGDPGTADRWIIAVQREAAGAGGSLAVHHALDTGSSVPAGVPRNNFALVESEAYLFVAGGIGITPLVPMMRAAVARGREVALVYGGRRRSTMAYADQLAALLGPRLHLFAEDETGRPPLTRLVAEARPDVQVYACGPEGLLVAVEQACADRPADNLHVERFSATAGTAADRPFRIRLAMSGLDLDVPPGRSILDVAEGAGLAPLASCRQGTCGTCETTVLDGAVEHRDTLLTADERAADETMMICVSRARGEHLTLDL